MAINFTVAYTFTPSTTIASSQVNTNFSDEAAVWQGLEALTKTFAKLKVDVDPTTALEVATKQYVDHYSTWRRPVLQYGSASTVAVESGLDGTSGNIPMLFPDGTVRTETSTAHTTFDITRNCSLSGTALSGLRATLSEAANTWYALYAVKVTDTSTTWVTVGDTRLPLQANYANLNTAFGTSGWVYLGMIRNGENNSATTDIIRFVQTGNFTVFRSVATFPNGLLLNTGAGVTSLTYSYANGTGTTSIPDHCKTVIYGGTGNSASTNVAINDQTGITVIAISSPASGTVNLLAPMTADPGVQVVSGAAAALKLYLYGFYDGVLGVGSLPLL